MPIEHQQHSIHNIGKHCWNGPASYSLVPVSADYNTDGRTVMNLSTTGRGSYSQCSNKKIHPTSILTVTSGKWEQHRQPRTPNEAHTHSQGRAICARENKIIVASMRTHPPPTTASAVETANSEQPVIYLYREKNAPCFLWTLALAPCLCPMVWYVIYYIYVHIYTFIHLHLHIVCALHTSIAHVLTHRYVFMLLQEVSCDSHGE